MNPPGLGRFISFCLHSMGGLCSDACPSQLNMVGRPPPETRRGLGRKESSGAPPPHLTPGQYLQHNRRAVEESVASVYYSDRMLKCLLDPVCGALLERKQRHKSVTRWIAGPRLLTAHAPCFDSAIITHASALKAHVACFTSWVGPTLLDLFLAC
jgi:hypothetical protein